MNTYTRRLATTAAAASLLFSSAGALAHISIPDIGVAGKTQVITFNVGHGCSGSDTTRVEVSIPAEVTVVRGVPSFFGYADVQLNASQAVTKVVWTKTTARAIDDQFYTLQLRIKVPDASFKTLYFPTTQYCADKDGVATPPTEWVGTPTSPSTDEPAPKLRIVPVHATGWNKYTVTEDIADLTVFDDAEIVWAGDSAYSANPTTTALIAGESDVTPLTQIPAGTEIWVKY